MIATNDQTTAACGATSLRVELPGADYFRRNLPCQHACPVNTDAGGYVRAIARGDFEHAYLIARGPNPLASICGRVCGAPCEAACRRGQIDKPVSIRALKRFVTTRYGPESGSCEPAELLQRLLRGAAARGRRSMEDIALLVEVMERSPQEKARGEPVAIIGSGPAGLAAAHDLALMGFRPRVFEMDPVAAGMLAVGIPEYRLPRDLIRAEVEVIRSLGVEIRCGVQVGVDVGFAELRAQHAATLIAVGAKRSRAIPIPGTDGRGVLGGVDFLRDVALGDPPPLSGRVVVIGGGNVAFDVSRTVVRQLGVDVTRTAAHAPEVEQVHLCCLESLEEMPADDVEILEGHEEGVEIHPSLGPREIVLDGDGRVRAVSFKRVVSVFDDQGRFAPVFDEDDVITIEADTVLWAIGQQTDLSFLDPEGDGIALTERGLVEMDAHTQRSSAPDVFVAGDAAHGVGLLIQAVASGKRAARAIHRQLRGVEFVPAVRERHTRVPNYGREPGYEKLRRTDIPVVAPEMRRQAQDIVVEHGYSEAQAVREASRCLDCGINTIFDSGRCVLCGGCVDVCPEDCLRIVSVGRLELGEDGRAAVDALCSNGSQSMASAIVKDEERCIRCAQCADRCPAEVISMERLSLEGAWNARRVE